MSFWTNLRSKTPAILGGIGGILSSAAVLDPVHAMGFGVLGALFGLASGSAHSMNPAAQTMTVTTATGATPSTPNLETVLANLVATLASSSNSTIAVPNAANPAPVAVLTPQTAPISAQPEKPATTTSVEIPIAAPDVSVTPKTETGVVVQPVVDPIVGLTRADIVSLVMETMQKFMETKAANGAAPVATKTVASEES